MIDPLWVDKLKPLVDQDMTIRNVLIEKGTLHDAYHSEMEKIHIKNAHILRRLIDQMGFPVLSNAGDQGVRLSWLIIHHAISLPDFMKTSLLEMRLAAAQQDYPLELLAYTEDLVAFLEGRKQVFGTHFDWLNGELVLTPVEDLERVNIRRKSLGLPPLLSNSQPLGMERPPKDPQKKTREFEQWLRRVGWR